MAGLAYQKPGGEREAPSAAQGCRAALAAFETNQGHTLTIGFVWLRRLSADVSVIEVTHGLAAAASKGLLNLTEPAGQLLRDAGSNHQLKIADQLPPAMTGTQWLLLISFAVTLLITCLLLIDAITEGRVKSKMPQLAAAYRRFSSSGALPDRHQGLPLSSFSTKQRLRMSSSSTNQEVWLKRLVLGVLIILTVILLGLLQARGERAVQSTSTQSATPSKASTSAGRSPASDLRSGSGEGKIIQLADVVDSVRPFQTVRIQGRYRGGADTFLRVQRWEGGKWLAFPLATKTDQSGRFTAYVELGQPGRYRLRVADPDSGVKSKPFVLVIKS